MQRLYDAIANCNHDTQNLLLMVVEGAHVGEHLLLGDGEVTYASAPDGLLMGHLAELRGGAGEGLVSVEGELVYREVLGAQKRLVVCGAGHVAIAIVKVAQLLGMHATVIDDRAEFAANAQMAGADEVLCQPFEEALAGIAGSTDTYYVVVTRGHSFDLPCLSVICRKPHAYIGLMGSRKRVAMAREELVDNGVDPAVVEKIHAPIGLPIAAETPEEIAISIFAEIVKVKNEKASATFGKDLLRAIAQHDGERLALCTIVDKQGSAPRNLGSRMVVGLDRTVGTIGGGLLESRVIEAARQLLAKPAGAPQLMRSELTNTDAQEEGEVCGGSLMVFIEEV